jgi:hypothetical protein
VRGTSVGSSQNHLRPRTVEELRAVVDLYKGTVRFWQSSASAKSPQPSALKMDEARGSALHNRGTHGPLATSRDTDDVHGATEDLAASTSLVDAASSSRTSSGHAALQGRTSRPSDRWFVRQTARADQAWYASMPAWRAYGKVRVPAARVASWSLANIDGSARVVANTIRAREEALEHVGADEAVVEAVRAP